MFVSPVNIQRVGGLAITPGQLCFRMSGPQTSEVVLCEILYRSQHGQLAVFSGFVGSSMSAHGKGIRTLQGDCVSSLGIPRPKYTPILVNFTGTPSDLRRFSWVGQYSIRF